MTKKTKTRTNPKCLFFFAWTNLASVQRRALDTHPGGRCPARPHEFTCVGPRSTQPQGAPGSHSQDTASRTTPSWPPASAVWIPTQLRTLVPARSVKSTPLSNPEGPRRGCAAGQHAQHFGLFVPRRFAHTIAPWQTWAQAPAPATAMETNSGSLSWVAQSILGRNPKAAGTEICYR